MVVADFSRNVRQGEKKLEGERRTSYESDIHSQYDKYQTSFEHSSNEGLANNVRPKKTKYVLADFSPKRRAKTSLRSERSALNQDGSGGVIDRNRMDQVEDTFYVDHQPKRKGRAQALKRQAPATTTLDSTVQNEGGVLDVMNTIGNTFYRVGVAIAFFLL